MTDTQGQGPAFDEAVRRIVRDVLRAELIDYVQTLMIRPEQITATKLNGSKGDSGDILKIDSDGVVRFEP